MLKDLDLPVLGYFGHPLLPLGGSRFGRIDQRSRSSNINNNNAPNHATKLHNGNSNSNCNRNKHKHSNNRNKRSNRSKDKYKKTSPITVEDLDFLWVSGNWVGAGFVGFGEFSEFRESGGRVQSLYIASYMVQSLMKVLGSMKYDGLDRHCCVGWRLRLGRNGPET